MIFTLCGSARFEPVWHEANKQLGLAGHISFSLMTFPSVEGGKSWYTPDQKTMLDLMHLAKIDASDAVLMLNVGDYLGESSRRELAWARYKLREIFWLYLGEHSIQGESYIDDLIGPEAFDKIREKGGPDAPL
jgi:ABC-type transporter Mla MlaB component